MPSDLNLILLHRTKKKLLSKFGRQRNAGRYLKVYNDDLFIVSYPRSGNTWMRFLIGAMVYDVDVDFENVNRLVPDIYRCSNQFLESLDRPRYLKSHEPFDNRYPKVIYLVRDPRDVAISYYRWLQKYVNTEQSFESFIEDFAGNKTRYGGWGNNVESWTANADRIKNGFFLVRYEDLLQDPVHKMQEISTFLAIEISSQRLENIVSQTQFDKMKEKEILAPKSNLIKGVRTDIKFVRKGTSGQWKQQFSAEQAALFSNSFQALSATLGYDMS